MQGVGAQTWQALIDGLQIIQLTDWLALGAEDLEQLPNFAKKRSAQTVQAFTQAKLQPFRAWLKALGAPASVTVRNGDNWQTLAALNPNSLLLLNQAPCPDLFFLYTTRSQT